MSFELKFELDETLINRLKKTKTVINSQIFKFFK